MIISFKKLTPDAKLPKQGKTGDAGFDFYSAEDVSLAPGETKAVSTGLVLAEMDPNDKDGSSIFPQVEGRSGLALKGIFPVGGIVDAVYRGEVKIILHNGNQPRFTPNPDGTYNLDPASLKPFEIKKGDRIASMVVKKIVTSDTRNMVLVAERDDIVPTDRGDTGFGSTGR